MYRTRVAGTGSFLPEKVLTNSDLEKMVDTNDQWIRERTGIESRRIAEPGQGPADLAYPAAKAALQRAGISATDLDMIIFATASGDVIMPSSACLLQEKLGCPGIAAFDLEAACSGFIYGMSLADQAIRTGFAKNILVVGAEVLHTMVNYKDRETCILFGDAAGAFVLSRADAEDPRVILDSFLRAEGQLGDLLTVSAGGSRYPTTLESVQLGDHFIKMRGREIFKNAVRVMASCCTTLLERQKLSADQVDWLIPHQANQRIMEAVADHVHFPMNKVVNIVKDMGNTSAATIPVAFDTAVADGRVQRGQTILLTAFGAGLTAGSLLLKY